MPAVVTSPERFPRSGNQDEHRQSQQYRAEAGLRQPHRHDRDIRRDIAMTTYAIEVAPAKENAVPLWAGMIVFMVLLFAGDRLLSDPDTYWQIAVGQWMVNNHAVPVTDLYSFTMRGEPWRSTQWLAQVMYGQAFAWGGCGGVVALTALGPAVAFALLARFMLRYLSEVQVMILLPFAFVIALPHLFARPHVLALPLMVAWVGALLSAAERREAPPFAMVVLIALWANIHGSFVLGLMLVGPIALDAVLNAEPSVRWRLLSRWFVFGVVAVVAACATPYGWNALFAARAILSLGDALRQIHEWQPADFSSVRVLEVSILLAIGLALFNGVKLPLMRTLLFVGLLYMTLAHVRNVDVFAFLAPMVVAAPLAAQFGQRVRGSNATFQQPQIFVVCGVAITLAVTAAAMIAGYRPAAGVTPTAAVAVLKEHRAERVFNDYNFGGYLISQGVPPFIDGRAELYGEAFVVNTFHALALKNVDKFLGLLDTYKIDATLLSPETPAVRLLDHLDGWQRIYTDDVAVVHTRKPGAGAAVTSRIKPASN
jgi:hypothetical protein